MPETQLCNIFPMSWDGLPYVTPQRTVEPLLGSVLLPKESKTKNAYGSPQKKELCGKCCCVLRQTTDSVRLSQTVIGQQKLAPSSSPRRFAPSRRTRASDAETLRGSQTHGLQQPDTFRDTGISAYAVVFSTAEGENPYWVSVPSRYNAIASDGRWEKSVPLR